MASDFYSQRSNVGWDFAYNSKDLYEVGVIDPDLLPSTSLIYRYFFMISPQLVGESTTALTSGIGLTTVDIGRDSVVFDLDFVTSSPIWNTLIQATTENTNGNILTLPKHVLDVAYVFKVTLNNSGNIEYFYKKDDSGPRPVSELPAKPNDSDGRDIWFKFYQSFKSGGEWDEYNRFKSKLGSVDQQYTLEHMATANQTNSKRIEVENLKIGDYYIVTYEGVNEHLFRHHVDMEFEQYIFASGGVSLSPPPFPRSLHTAHYLWKQWKDSDGKEHEGWRISESWNMNIASYKLLNDSISYDPVNNPVVGKQTYVSWSLFNMVEKNLRLEDSARVGYSYNYAKFLESQIPLSSMTDASVAQMSSEDTNNINQNNVHRDNFLIEFVAENTVNYSGSAAAWATITGGGAFGVLFNAPYGQYDGHVESAYYKKRFPKNTRIVSAFSRIRHGANGRVIAVKMKRGTDYVTVVEDPFFFMTIKNKLYYHYFNDGLSKMQLADRKTLSQDEMKYLYPSDTILTGSDGGCLPGMGASPGRNILLENNENSSSTFLDDTGLTSATARYNVPTSYASFISVSNPITDVTNSYANKPEKALSVFRIQVPANSIIGALRIKLTPTNSSNNSSLLRIRGESGIQSRELVNVSVICNEILYVDLGAWENIDYIFIMSDISCRLDICDQISLSASISSEYHLLEEVNTMAATTDMRGNFLLFYCDRDDRVNILLTPNAGGSWKRYESILVRGDAVSDICGVPNDQNNVYFLFYFYKDALLCVPFDLSVFLVDYRNKDKLTEAIDVARRQMSYLVWGRALKPDSEKLTQVDGDGNITFEDIKDNLILSESDMQIYQNNFRSVFEINKSQNADTSTKKINSGNKFIIIGKNTVEQGLAITSPSTREYSVFRSKRGSLRLFISDIRDDIAPYYRYLVSHDDGFNWMDGWQNPIEYSNSDGSMPINKIIRINYLSLGDNTEEGTNLSLLYNASENKVYMFYFYSGAILCKVVDDEIFDISDFDKKKSLFDNSPIYAIAGNLNAVTSESNYATLPAGETRKIIFNEFQRNYNNIVKYYNEEYYNPQPISGYFTEYGYIRIFLINNKSTIDGYFYDGGIWRPEQVIINENSFNGTLWG